MTLKILSTVFCIFLFLCDANAQLQTINGRIKIKVVTTAGCGDTVNFIANQLADAYQEYGRFLEVEFVPWGRTVRNPNRTLTCQFGTADCLANRIQRCSLDLLKDNQDAQMAYMMCEFSSPYPSYLEQTYLCAHNLGLSLVPVDYCVLTTGGALDDASEEKAREPMAIINFVPAIVFNDVIDQSLHTQARTRLKSMICLALAADPSTGVTNC